MRMRYEWDAVKNKRNFRKHGIWFEEAQTVWADPHSMEYFDPENSHNEDRYIRIGHSIKLNLLVVVFSEFEDQEKIRIISARIATRKESGQYETRI